MRDRFEHVTKAIDNQRVDMCIMREDIERAAQTIERAAQTTNDQIVDMCIMRDDIERAAQQRVDMSEDIARAAQTIENQQADMRIMREDFDRCMHAVNYLAYVHNNIPDRDVSAPSSSPTSWIVIISLLTVIELLAVYEAGKYVVGRIVGL